MAWRWEADWYLDTNFCGKELDKQGWTYAIDFPAEYHAKKSFSSCVRRRKWIRCCFFEKILYFVEHPFLSCRFFADTESTWRRTPGLPSPPCTRILQRWSLILQRFFFYVLKYRLPIINQEPFIDVSVGGNEIPNGDPSELQVWTVTILGRVFARQGVTATCPEGTGWLRIPTPDR